MSKYDRKYWSQWCVLPSKFIYQSCSYIPVLMNNITIPTDVLHAILYNSTCLCTMTRMSNLPLDSHGQIQTTPSVCQKLKWRKHEKVFSWSWACKKLCVYRWYIYFSLSNSSEVKVLHTIAVGQGPIKEDELGCSGNETHIDECFLQNVNGTKCSHVDDVGVDCRGKTFIIKKKGAKCVHL